MGLLDDAIREHLDLKRARGADPADIERMAREALGPVRREPTIGSARFEDAEEAALRHFDEPAYREEHSPGFEDLGYHDSTAPHPHHGHAHDHLEHPHPEDYEPIDEHLDLEHLHPDHLEAQAEQMPPPRRRFLRRNRPASLAGPAHDHFELGEPMAGEPDFDQESLPGEAPEPPGARGEPGRSEELRPTVGPAARQTRPPQLQFDQPPKRPRFTPEPPSLQRDMGEEPEGRAEASGSAPQAPEPARAQPAAASPEPPTAPERPSAPSAAEPTVPVHPAAAEYEHFDDHPEDDPDAQETTEFDVQKHLTQARHDEDEAVLDEDVLEETPEFLQDTPEHDRLWFEQRPPKDFDFNG